MRRTWTIREHNVVKALLEEDWRISAAQITKYLNSLQGATPRSRCSVVSHINRTGLRIRLTPRGPMVKKPKGGPQPGNKNAIGRWKNHVKRSPAEIRERNRVRTQRWRQRRRG